MKRTITSIPPKPKGKNTLRVAAYCRVSTQFEIQQLSLNTQIEYYKEVIRQHEDWQFAGIYADVASGTNRYKRPQFSAMLDACRKQEIDLILTKSISRFARNAVDVLEVLNDLKRNDIDVYFESENLWLQQQTSMFAISILAAIAQEESVSRSDNIKWGIATGFRLGTSRIADRPCYGYHLDEGGRLCIVTEQANVVQEIFKLYLNGNSLSGISKELYNAGIPSPTGKEKWTSAAITKLLSNEKYTGDVLLQKTTIKDYWNHRQGKNTGQYPKYVFENNNPAIISPSVFEAVQKEKGNRSNIIQSNQGKEERKHTRFSSGNRLSGKIICGVCGRNYRRITTHSGEIVWRCAGRVEKSEHKCMSQTLKQKTIVELIMSTLDGKALYLDCFMQAVERIVVSDREMQITMKSISTEANSIL